MNREVAVSGDNLAVHQQEISFYAGAASERKRAEKGQCEKSGAGVQGGVPVGLLGFYAVFNS